MKVASGSLSILSFFRMKWSQSPLDKTRPRAPTRMFIFQEYHERARTTTLRGILNCLHLSIDDAFERLDDLWVKLFSGFSTSSSTACHGGIPLPVRAVRGHGVE